VSDCVSGEQQTIAAQQILKLGDQFITIAGDNPKMKVTLKYLVTVGSSLLGSKIRSTLSSAKPAYGFHRISENYQDLDGVRTRFLETGKVKPMIDTVFDWRRDSVDTLHESYENRRVKKARQTTSQNYQPRMITTVFFICRG
jgi:hypothetical protein